MKRYISILKLCVCLATLGGILWACSTRPIPTSQIITLYNSDLREVKKLSPMDTLYVEVAGLAENNYYAVTVEDPDGNVISTIETATDADGVINATPLWYDVGLKKPDATHPYPYLAKTSELSLSAFTIRVKSLPPNEGKTDFHQDLFFITTDFTIDSKPKPVITACFKFDETDACYPENAFEETDSRAPDGSPSAKTTVYVQGEQIPWKADGKEVTQVDIYIMPFDGNVIDNGEILDSGLPSQKNVAVTSSAQGTTKVLPPTPVWDLNQDELRNPGPDNSTFRVVVDVNRNGMFDSGVDLNDDGITDEYVDGIDGNSVPGFIVQNTPANDLSITIKNGPTADADEVNSLYESEAALDEELFVFIDNIPTMNKTIDIYVVEDMPNLPADGSPLTDARNGGGSTVAVSVPDDDSLQLMPFAHGATLINTSLNNAYSYIQDVPSQQKVKLSIIVDINSDGIFRAGDGDLFFSRTTDPQAYVTVLAVESNVETYADENKATQTRTFDETHTENGNTTVWVDVEGTSGPFTMHLFEEKEWTEGDDLAVALISLTGDGSNLYEFWDLNGEEVQVINPGDDALFDIVVDFDNSGTYTAADMIVTIAIQDTKANSLPKLQYTNIASGGKFGDDSPGYFDYRDTFKTNGKDTKGNWYVKHGIKAVWNPYIKHYGGKRHDYAESSQTLYEGKCVSVYIVDASKFDLSDWDVDKKLSDSIDVTGRHMTMPVQPSCNNGAGQQNIWKAPMKAGKYYVIVDVNRNHRIDEGVDIIDAVNAEGHTIEDDPEIIGFSVIP